MQRKMLPLVLGLIVLGACAWAADTYTLYTWSGAEGTEIESLSKYWNANFAAKEGFTVAVVQFGRDEFFSKMVSMITSKSDTWQAFMVFNFYVPSFAQDGNLMPLDKYYNDSQYLKPTYTRHIKSGLDMLSYDGKIYGVPQTIVSLGTLRYRSDLIDQLLKSQAWKAKYGSISNKVLGKTLQPKRPDQWTWDDYIAAALFFTKKYNPDSPTEFGTVFQGKSATGVQFPATFYPMLRSMGGDIIRDGKSIINSTEGMKAISYLLDLRLKYEVVPPDVYTYEAFEEYGAFQTGKVAFGIDWDWDAAHLVNKGESPNVFDKMKETVPPAGPIGRFAYVQEFGWVINNYTTDSAKDGMAKFLLWASASDEGIQTSLKTGIPPGAFDPKIMEGAGLDTQLANHYFFYYDNILNAKKVGAAFWPLVPAAPEIYTSIANNLGQALGSGLAYGAALSNTEKDINDALKH